MENKGNNVSCKGGGSARNIRWFEYFFSGVTLVTGFCDAWHYEKINVSDINPSDKNLTNIVCTANCVALNLLWIYLIYCCRHGECCVNNLYKTLLYIVQLLVYFKLSWWHNISCTSTVTCTHYRKKINNLLQIQQNWEANRQVNKYSNRMIRV